MEISGDISGEWKIVMHEESKHYYYWNTLTGETSWEVPNVLVSAAISTVTSDVPDLGLEPIDADMNGTEFVSASASAFATTDLGSIDGNLGIAYDISQSEPNCQIAEVDAHCCTSSGLIDFGSEHLTVSLDRETNGAFAPQEETGELQERTYDYSTDLIKKCEELLKKLKAVEGSGRPISHQTWAHKYIIELETRLSDCRSLLSFGSSIIPFWRNTEMQLQRIEIAVAESSSIKSLGHPDEVGDPEVSLNSHHLIVKKEDGDASNPVIASSKSPDKKMHLDIDQHPVAADIRNSESPQRTSETILEETTSSSAIEQSVVLQPEFKVDLDAIEDADMDVEMEVDDDIPPASLGTVEPIGVEQPCYQHVQDCIPPVPSDEFIVPPPPDEEWVPPPPPDGDLVPLPPIEEPPFIPEAPYSETGQPLHYAEHYDTVYSASSYQYYAAPVTEVQSSGYYSHVDGSHVAQVQNQEYFGLGSTSYPNAHVAVSVEPGMLYDAHTGIVSSVSATTNYDSAVIYAEPGFSDPGNIYASGFNGTVELVKNIDEKMELLSQKVDSELANIYSGTERTDTQVCTSSHGASTAGDSLGNGNSADATFTSARNQAKARTKKRVSAVAVGSTLRSNKKVASLVDKWKAAKEELHGDEDDEPEDPYETFEKKRKKEIEEWHAKQIASGEVQDNANFVPLRGDWRQRIKRKQTSESSTTSSQAPAEQDVKEKRQPDLVELAKGLPPGWQAYWDENSKEVYYGNLKTSETTWTRPST